MRHICLLILAAQLSAAHSAPASSLTPVNTTATSSALHSIAVPSRLHEATPAPAPLQRQSAANTLRSTTPAASLHSRNLPAAQLQPTQALLSELNAQETAEHSILIALSGDILFDFDRAELRADAQPTLEKVRAVLASYPDAPVQVHGHTDSKGSDAYNLELSTRRAQSVAHALQSASTQPITIHGHGESLPVAHNEHADGRDNPEGRQLNRRVEVEITRPQGKQ